MCASVPVGRTDGHVSGRACVGRDPGVDAGYLSRILKDFERQALIDRTVTEHDGRQRMLALTDAGRAAFAPLDAASRMEIGAMNAVAGSVANEISKRSFRSLPEGFARCPEVGIVTPAMHRIPVPG